MESVYFPELTVNQTIPMVDSPLLAPFPMELESTTTTTNATNASRRKARRAPRKNERSSFKPYSHLTWQERRDLELKEAVANTVPNRTVVDNTPILLSTTSLTLHKNKRHRHRRHAAREQPPPAPRNLTQMIVAEHQSPDAPAELDDSFYSGADNRQDSVSSCEASMTDNFFEKAYEESLYDDLRHLTHEGLIDRIRARDRELESLHEQLRLLRSSHAVASA